MDSNPADRLLSQYVEREIVPVHKPSCSNSKPYGVKSLKSSMRVKDDERSIEDKISSMDMSDWLSGGSIGGRNTVLVFRSCLLAPRDNGSMDTKLSSPPSELKVSRKGSLTNISERDEDGRRIRNISDNKRNCKDAESGLDNDALFGERVVVKTKRDIRDVLKDINMISMKRKNNGKNSNDDSDKQNEDDDSGNETVSPKSSQSSLHGPTSTISPNETPDSIDLSMSFSTAFSDMYNKDFKELKFLEPFDMPASILKLHYKTCSTETKLLNRLLYAHGFTECPLNSRDYSLLWTGLHAKPDLLRSLGPHQRVNHFPRSYELTRKDKLFKNIEKMQHMRASKSFDFVPLTFLMPIEYPYLCSAHYRTKGPWIIKPAASSRGRGIYIVNSPDKIPKGESVVVAKYIDKPLLVDGHKCDLRLYVCVTSFDPLLIYLYEEGLVRFATVKYDKDNKTLWNPCMHLCNYSINKYHCDYVKSNDPSVENVGHKWTLSALLRHLKREGHDTGVLMASIEDVVIKSILSCTHSIATATQKFVPYINNCFELYGFDILIDENLKPWLIEINLSPSLGCDSPLDARLKSSLIADTLTLVGIPAYSKVYKGPVEKDIPANSRPNLKMRIVGSNRVHSFDMASSSVRKGFTNSISNQGGISFLSNAEMRLINMVTKQYERRGGYVRIFPSQDSWQKYAQYLDPITGIPMCVTPLPTNGNEPPTTVNHNYNLLVHSQILPDFDQTIVNTSTRLPKRLSRYERVLPVCSRVNLESSPSPGPSSSRSSSANPGPIDHQVSKSRLIRLVERGKRLTVIESRRAFGMFLQCILKRISSSKSDPLLHADLVHRFLKKMSISMSFIPYNLKISDVGMTNKDKSAMIAKELNDFLYLYHRESENLIDNTEKKMRGLTADFANFIRGASEADLEDLLLLVIRLEGNIVPFLGDGLSPMCIDLPTNKLQPLIPRRSDSPNRAPVLLRYLAFITPLHSRRYTYPTPENPTFNDDHSLDSL